MKQRLGGLPSRFRRNRVRQAAVAFAGTALPVLTALALQGEGARAGFEVFSNFTDIPSQRNIQVASDPNGDAIVVFSGYGYDNDGAFSGVKAWKIDAFGRFIKPGGGVDSLKQPVTVNTTTTGNEKDPAVAVDENGDFVVVWEGGPNDLTSYDIYFQRFSKDFQPVGPEVKLTSQPPTGRANHFDPSVAMDKNGDFVVTWVDSTALYGVVGQRFNADGTPKAGVFNVASETGYTRSHSRVAMDADGDFAVSWTSYQQDYQNSRGVYARAFKPDGNPYGPEFRVNTSFLGNQEWNDIAMARNDGTFIVVFQDAPLGGGLYTKARTYSVSGSPILAEFSAADTNTGNETTPAVSMSASGEFVIAWEDAEDGGGRSDQPGPQARRFHADGSPYGAQFPLNTYTLGFQGDPDVAMDADGDFVGTWSTYQNYYFATGPLMTFQRFTGSEPVDVIISETGAAADVVTDSLYSYDVTIQNAHGGDPTTGVGNSTGITLEVDSSDGFFNGIVGNGWECAATNFCVASGYCQTCINVDPLVPGADLSFQVVLQAPSTAGSLDTTFYVNHNQFDPKDNNGFTGTRNIVAPDGDPDPLNIPIVFDAELDQLITSDPVTVSGINVPVAIHVQNGFYNINGGSFTNVDGTVSDGDVVRVQVQSSTNFATTTSASLFVGSGGGDFLVETKDDLTPDPFHFNPKTGVAVNSTQTSNAVTITGVTYPPQISITGGLFSINGGPFQAGPTSNEGSTSIRVRQTASPNPSTTTIATLTVGTVSEDFSVTTADDTTPNAFNFTAQNNVPLSSVRTSNSVTIQGVSVPVAISITGGKYSIDGGAFTSGTGTISAGQAVQVRQTASASPSTPTTANLTVGTFTSGFVVTTEAADTDPDAFTFFAQNNVPLSSQRTSNAITVAGINVPATISVTGGEYKINSGAFTAVSGSVSSGDTVRVRQTASAVASTSTTATLTIGTVSSGFVVTTADDTTPDGFAFTPLTNVPTGSTQTSNAITVAGITAPAAVTIAGGTYSVNGGAFTAAAGQVSAGDQVAVQQVASASPSTKTTATLTVGGVSADFDVTTADDTTPDDFGFGAQGDVPLSSVRTSNAVTIQGVNVAVPVSVTGGKYSIDGGAFVNTPGTIAAGQQVAVRQTASPVPSTNTIASLTVGTVTRNFSVTTEAADTTPNPFTFNAQTDVATGATRTSNTVTIQGVNIPATISVTGGRYSINNGAFVNATGTVSAGDKVAVRQTASSSPSTTTTATLTVGTYSTGFDVRTADDVSPDPFGFTTQTGVAPSSVQTSNPVTIAGVSVATPISIAGGTYKVNNGQYTGTAGNVVAGDVVRVRQTASANPSTTTIATLTVGTFSADYVVTTADDTTPDAFSFASQADVPFGSVRTSVPVTIGGINVATPISVSGGSYSIDGGAFTTLAGTVSPGASVRARQKASDSPSQTTIATVTIGGVAGTFSVTTEAADTTPNTFTFNAQADVPFGSTRTSNTVTVHGINVSTPVSVAGGKVSINGGTFGTAGGFVVDGDTLAVRQTASDQPSTKTTATLTVGTYGTGFDVTTVAADTTPDAFGFGSATDVELATQTTSGAVTIQGINVATPISIAGGSYKVNAGAFTQAAGTVVAGDQVTVRVTSSSQPATTKTATVTIGGGTGSFSVTTVPADITPDSFTFGAKTDVAFGSTQTSNVATIAGLNTSADVSVAGGSYKINGGAFRTTPAQVQNGDTVTVRQTASDSPATKTTATLTVGTYSTGFDVTTEAADTTPDAFTFGSATGVELSTQATSSAVTIGGINVAAPISIAGGSYKVNAGAFTQAAGTVVAGDQVTVRVTSSAQPATTKTATVTIGGGTGAFSVTTVDADLQPDPFSFAPKTNVAFGSVQTSSTATIAGLNTAADVGVTGGSYRINGGAFRTTPATVQNGDTVTVRQTASASPATTTTATLTVGTFSTGFDVTTEAADTDPDPFAFADKNGVDLSTQVASDAATIGGINVAAPISVQGGAYQVNAGAFTTAAGTVNAGDQVVVRVTSSPTPATKKFATLTIGTVSAKFTTKTVPADVTPDPFAFTPDDGVPFGSVQTSDTVTIQGLNTSAPVSISGGSWKLNGGSFSTTGGTVVNGDKITLRQTASAEASTTTTAMVTVGTYSTGFDVTTQGRDVDPDPIVFAPKNNVPLGAVRTSALATITGINTAAPISVTGGSYNVNGGAFVTTAGTVLLGDTVSLRVTAANQPAKSRTATLTIGSVSGSFTVTTEDPDTDADPFTFPSQTDVPLGVKRISAPITVAGINTGSIVRVTNGEYRINGGAFATATGTVKKDDTVEVRVQASSATSTTTTATLSIGTTSGTFSVTTEGPDTTPDSFAFPAQTGVPFSDVRTSATRPIAGINVTTPISVTGGKYSINGGAFTNVAGTVSSGNTVAVQLTSSASPATPKTATLTVGTFSTDFTVTTVAADTDPDPFTFPAQADVPMSSVRTSAARTIAGINVAAPIGIAGGTYSIDGGPFKSAAGTISSGSTVTVRLTSSASPSTPKTATLTVGGFSTGFTVTTEAADTTPNPFAFPSQTDVPFSDVRTSATRTIAGINVATPVSVTGGKYSVNGGAFVTAAGTVSAGDTVAVQVTASASPATPKTATLTVGTFSTDFTVTTIAADTDPDPFTFPAQTDVPFSDVRTSATRTVSGINVAAAISIAGGKYSVDGGPFKSAAGTISSGSTVAVQVTASASPSTPKTATLTVGSYSTGFTVTTQSSDSDPDPFTFPAKTGVPVGTLVVSDPVTIAGINVPAPISVSGGSYRINNGSFVQAAGTVSAGDQVTVRVNSSPDPSTAKSATVTIGTVQGTFTVTTEAPDITPDPFAFTALTGVAFGSVQTSETVTIQGLNTSATVHVTGGKYSIDGGPFTNVDGSITNGHTVAVQQTASALPSDTTTTKLTVGTLTRNFAVTTQAADTSPTPFTFASQSGVPVNSLRVSAAITVQGVNVATPIGVVNGMYRVNAGAFTSAAGTVVAGDQVIVQQQAADTPSTQKTTTLTIGDQQGTFKTTTEGPDGHPNPFAFNSQSNVPLSSVRESNAIVVSGINIPVAIGVTNGEYAVNGGAYTSAAGGTVKNGDSVTVRHTSAAAPATAKTTTLSIGDVNGNFTSTTVAQDATPNAFAFIDQAGVAAGATADSNVITVSGINVGVTIHVTGGRYRVNGTGGFVNTDGTIVNGDQVQVRATASSTPGAKVDVVLTIGGVSDTFSVTTSP